MHQFKIMKQRILNFLILKERNFNKNLFSTLVKLNPLQCKNLKVKTREKKRILVINLI